VSKSVERLAAEIAAGNKAAVAEALNTIEDRRAEAQARAARLLAMLPLRENAHRIGLTGPPGVGKSSLASELEKELRSRSLTVGVLAVDPSSLRSGGAMLGDRARMARNPADPGSFMRSLATAGMTGGLARAAGSALAVLSAAYDRVIVETVGVGQSETDVEHVVDSVCLVVQPGSGDALQFMKAGIMEIPHLIAVNKGDQRELAERALSDAKHTLAELRRTMAPSSDVAWKIPVLLTSALDATGIDGLANALERHRDALSGTALRARRRTGAAKWVCGVFAREHGEHGLETLGGRAAVENVAAAAIDAGDNPLAIASRLSERYLHALAGSARA
jgi:LAO/AO transport system kinase